MRVLLVGEYAVGSGHAVSGVQAVTRVLAGALARHPDVQLDVIAYQLGIEEDELPCDGYTLHCVPANPDGGLTTKGRSDRRRLLRKFNQIRPDVIHANQCGVHALAAFDSGIPTVLTVHGIFWWLGKALYGNDIKGRARRILLNRLHKECLRRAEHLILISPYVWEAIKPFTRATTYRIDVPIDPVYFEQTRVEAANELLFVGLISPRKGVDYLLQAFQTVLETHPDLKLSIVGKVADNQYYASLLSYAEMNKLVDKVSWLGTMDRPSLAARYASSSMLVLPSLEETTPGVIAEAMAVGCPVVASRVGGIPDMLEDSQTGLLVGPRDPDGLALAILRLLEDRELSSSISEQAKIIATERYAPWSVAAKTVEVYRRVIKAESGKSTYGVKV